MSNAIVQQAQANAINHDANDIADMMEALRPSFDDVLQAVPRERFVRLALGAFRGVAKLRQCTKASIIDSLMKAAALGLEPNTPLDHCYLIPRWNRKANAYECTLMIGYKGWLKILYDTGKVVDATAAVVHANDVYDYTTGTTKTIVHKPALGDRGTIIAAWACIRTTNGGIYTENMDIADIEAIRSRGEGGDAWTSDYDMMARKTVLKRTTKYMDTTIINKAYQYDHTEPLPASDGGTIQEPDAADDSIREGLAERDN